MLLDSRRFMVGNKAFLITPSVYLDRNRKLIFMHHQKFATDDLIASLDIYLANEVGFAEYYVRNVDPSNTWSKKELIISVKPGIYRIVFRATCGKPFESDIALDKIQVINYNGPVRPWTHIHPVSMSSKFAHF